MPFVSQLHAVKKQEKIQQLFIAEVFIFLICNNDKKIHYKEMHFFYNQYHFVKMYRITEKLSLCLLKSCQCMMAFLAF